jgi:hypothetical protein
VFFALTLTYALTLTLFILKGTLMYAEFRPVARQLLTSHHTGHWNQFSNKYVSQWNRIDGLMTDYSHSFFSPIKYLVERELKFDVKRLWDEIAPLGLIAPELIGLENPKEYLVVFQNPAEARGTGGIIGLFAVIELSRSGFTVKQVGSNSVLNSLDEIPLVMPPDYVDLYGSDPAIWQNSNLSPHFPHAAEIYLELYRTQFGYRLDGVIAVDPYVLKALMSNLGPLNINGVPISESNVIEWTLSKSYSYFDNKVDERKTFLVELVSLVGRKLEEGNISTLGVIADLIEPLLDHRILFFSSDKDLQKHILQSQISGKLDSKSKNEYRLVIIDKSPSIAKIVARK